MAMNKHFPSVARRPRDIKLGGNFTIGAAGAVTTQSTLQHSGVTVTKVGGKSGRYLLTYDRVYKRQYAGSVNMIGPDDAAFPTTTGSNPQLRLFGLSNASSMTIQCKRQDTEADADPASGTVIVWTAHLATV